MQKKIETKEQRRGRTIDDRYGAIRHKLIKKIDIKKQEQKDKQIRKRQKKQKRQENL